MTMLILRALPGTKQSALLEVETDSEEYQAHVETYLSALQNLRLVESAGHHRATTEFVPQVLKLVNQPGVDEALRRRAIAEVDAFTSAVAKGVN